jgi:hypothetical protein
MLCVAKDINATDATVVDSEVFPGTTLALGNDLYRIDNRNQTIVTRVSGITNRRPSLWSSLPEHSNTLTHARTQVCGCG